MFNLNLRVKNKLTISGIILIFVLSIETAFGEDTSSEIPKELNDRNEQSITNNIKFKLFFLLI
jgi:hypothetical protein